MSHAPHAIPRKVALKARAERRDVLPARKETSAQSSVRAAQRIHTNALTTALIDGGIEISVLRHGSCQMNRLRRGFGSRALVGQWTGWQVPSPSPSSGNICLSRLSARQRERLRGREERSVRAAAHVISNETSTCLVVELLRLFRRSRRIYTPRVRTAVTDELLAGKVNRLRNVLTKDGQTFRVINDFV